MKKKINGTYSIFNEICLNDCKIDCNFCKTNVKISFLNNTAKEFFEVPIYSKIANNTRPLILPAAIGL